MSELGLVRSKEVLANESKSFSLAAKLLSPSVGSDVAVLYAWCRRADDAIDLAGDGSADAALLALRRELDRIYGPEPMNDPIPAEAQRVFARHAIPKIYPEELLLGMAMDAAGHRYTSLEDLHLYCFRVAGVVGLMMCHLLGVRRASALPRAVHLGMAMQLTNICRDVIEDWARGRLYLPDTLLTQHGAAGLRDHLGDRFPERFSEPVSSTIGALLGEADRFYASADLGLIDLRWRAALAVRTARNIYSGIGDVLRARACDPTIGRAVVSSSGKLVRLLRACVRSLLELPERLRLEARYAPPPRALRFPGDVL